MRTFKCSDCGEPGSSMWGTICEKCIRRFGWKTKEMNKLDSKMSRLKLLGAFLVLIIVILLIILLYYVQEFKSS